MATHVRVRPLWSVHCIRMAVLTSIRAWQGYSQRFESWTPNGICEIIWRREQSSFTPEQRYWECLFHTGLWPPDLGWYPNRPPQSQFPAVSKFIRVSQASMLHRAKKGINVFCRLSTRLHRVRTCLPISRGGRLPILAHGRVDNPNHVPAPKSMSGLRVPFTSVISSMQGRQLQQESARLPWLGWIVWTQWSIDKLFPLMPLFAAERN